MAKLNTSKAVIASATDVLNFWREAGPEHWFKKDTAFDDQIRERFLATYETAVRGELAGWEPSTEGTLALVIVLDQFPRNMFRGSSRAFAADPIARAVTERALDRGIDRDMPLHDRQFLYLPLEHSENLADQERCCELFRASGDTEALKWAELHADIIRHFGRFPHRNAVLGRTTTADEQAFLDAGGFSG